MPLHKSRFKHFVESSPVKIPLPAYPYVLQQCNACGHPGATGIDMTPDTDNPKKKRYMDSRCENCGVPWGAFSPIKKEE